MLLDLIIHYWDYISLSFKEISRILKKNGHFLTINYRLGGRLKERYMPIKEGNYTYLNLKNWNNFKFKTKLLIIKCLNLVIKMVYTWSLYLERYKKA